MKKVVQLCGILLLVGAYLSSCSEVLDTLDQPHYHFAEVGTKNFISEITIGVGEPVSLDLYLSNVPAGQGQSAGGAWIDFTGSTGLLSYVSGGRCMTGGSEGCTGPWSAGAGVFINEPDAGSGPIEGAVLYIVANLAAPFALPDGEGDLIVGTLTLQCDGPGDATVNLSTVPGVGTWSPIDDATVLPATLLIRQGGGCECEIDADCNDNVTCTTDVCNNCTCENTPDDAQCDNGLVCDGTEVCDPLNDCQAGTPVECPPGEACEEPGVCVPLPECEIDGDCNDNVACTIDVCNSGTCENTPNDAQCDNGLVCDGTEVCDPLTGCQAGTPVECPPGEACEEPGVCVPLPECETDGDCNDNVACTIDVCNSGTCEYTPDDARCPDDGDFCNGTEFCDAVQGCSSTGNPCDEGEECDEVNDVCVVENLPPDCSAASADISELWPPNHKYVGIAVIGVTDPDGDPVTIAIDAITQDEEVNARGMGDGNTAPDAKGLGSETASVRAERQGGGNGRVYEISFTALDGMGASCSGSVRVCVPHDQRSGRACIDDGQSHDSTERR